MRARPSDALLLSVDVDGAAPWLDPVDIVPLCTWSGRPGASGAARARSRPGWRRSATPSRSAHETVGTDPDDLVMISRDVDGARPWLDPAEPVRLRAPAHGRPPHRPPGCARSWPGCARSGSPWISTSTRCRWRSFGPRRHRAGQPGPRRRRPVARPGGAGPAHAPDPGGAPGQPVGGRDGRAAGGARAPLRGRLAGRAHRARRPRAARRDLDSSAPWLDPDEAVSPIHLLRAAERTGRPVAEVAERLRSVGLRRLGAPTRAAERRPRSSPT